jgi:Transglycosylase SLT domain
VTVQGASRAAGSPPSVARPAGAAAALVFAAFLAAMLAATLGAIGGLAIGGPPSWVERVTPSALARRDIPARYLMLYENAAQRYGIDWAILAAVGKVECDHGRDPDPSCTRDGATNSAGAGGPMQFVASTWAGYGVEVDGDGQADRWSPADAIYSAANYLRASGAPHDNEGALLAYNHAGWYVAEVLRWATLYRAPTAAGAPPDTPDAGESLAGSVALQSRTPTRVLFTAGPRAQLLAGESHVALIPQQAPAAVQAMIVAGNELQGLRYGPGGHPDPRGVPEEDCSSSVNYVLYRAGVRPLSEVLYDNPLAQSYVSWGAPGPGRWVTIYAADSPTPHVFIVIAGLRLDTSHAGTDVGPNGSEDGPRWRVLDHIPQWAHWSVRHSPGL